VIFSLKEYLLVLALDNTMDQEILLLRNLKVGEPHYFVSTAKELVTLWTNATNYMDVQTTIDKQVEVDHSDELTAAIETRTLRHQQTPFQLQEHLPPILLFSQG